MRFIAATAAAGVAIIAVIAILVFSNQSSGVNVSTSMTAANGTRTDCYDGGIMELAGEREKVYDCTWSAAYVKQHLCVFVEDGNVYTAGRERC